MDGEKKICGVSVLARIREGSTWGHQQDVENERTMKKEGSTKSIAADVSRAKLGGRLFLMEPAGGAGTTKGAGSGLSADHLEPWRFIVDNGPNE